MIKIGSRTGHKIGILLVLTTLAIGSAAGLSWENPSSEGESFDGDIVLNASTDGSVNNVAFWYKLSEDVNYTLASNETSSQTGGFYVYDSLSVSDGNYDLKVNTTSGESAQILNNIFRDTVNPNDPSSLNPSDGAFISDTSPTVELSVSDDLSGVDYTYLNVTNSDGDEIDDTEGTSLELDDLSEDVYTVDYTIVDDAGNDRTGSWDFTVDTSYDGDSNPSFSVEDESDGVVLFNEDKDLTVDFGDADSTSATTVTCYVGGEDVDSFTVDTGDGDTEYTCEIPEDDDKDYYDTSADIYLEMEDEAGNIGESNSETVSFDVNPPSVTGLEIPINANLYNTDFDVDFSAFDSASSVEEVEYYFDSSTSLGEGTEFDSVDQDSYEIDTSSLEADDHTLYVRAKDEADRWSSADTVDFSFDPDAVPEISLDVPESVSVTAGEQGSFDVTVENTGELHISSIELSGSSEGVFSDSQSISDLEPGESITATLDIDTEAINIGEHTIEVSTDNPSRTEQIDLLVEANSEQQSRIDSELSKHQSKLQEMETNVTNLKQKVSEEKKQRLESNFSKFKQKVEDAQSAVDRGDYYEAEAGLEGIDQDEAAAERSYSTVREEYENNRFWMFILLGIGGFVVAVVGLIGGVSYTDEVDFDIIEYLEELQELEFDFESSSLEKYTDKFKRALEGKDTSDAEDFEWDGFDGK